MFDTCRSMYLDYRHGSVITGNGTCPQDACEFSALPTAEPLACRCERGGRQIRSCIHPTRRRCRRCRVQTTSGCVESWDDFSPQM
jgi:hypothetical protein